MHVFNETNFNPGQQYPAERQENGSSTPCGVKPNRFTQISNIRIKINEPIPLETTANRFQATVIDTDQETNLKSIRKNISDRRSAFLSDDSKGPPLVSRVKIILSSPQNQQKVLLGDESSPNILECTSSNGDSRFIATTMETSVDSIGTCSLDMEASTELPSGIVYSVKIVCML